jgi:tetratricopeptide (TPR) repeat protein
MSEAPAGGQDSRPEQEPATSAAPATGPGGNQGDPAGGGAGPGHDAYDLYRRGMELLGRGSAAAAAQLLERAAAAEPQSRSVLEGLARAQFDAGRYAAAAGNFRRIVEASPSDDYAQFGLGLALARTGDPGAAAEHLALAAAMAPDRRHYADALRSVRATLRARTRARDENPQNSERPGSDA